MRRAWMRFRTIGKWLLGAIAFVALVRLLTWLDYRFGWTGYGTYKHPQTGDPLWGKSLWDWMDLLIVPVVLAVGALQLNQAERRAERELATDRTQEAALQGYFGIMTELLLEKQLRESEPSAEVRDIARARTLATLRVLDGVRKGLALRFLYETILIDAGLHPPVVDLRDADLSGADLWRGVLICVSLSDTDLCDADLTGAMLLQASLRRSNLRGASLRDAHLADADLTDAKYNGRTILPDGTKWTPDTDMARFTSPEHPDYWQSSTDPPAYRGEEE